MTAVDETTTYDARTAVLTHYLIRQSEHDSQEEIERAKGDESEVARRQLAQAILETAMDAEDKDPDPRRGAS